MDPDTLAQHGALDSSIFFPQPMIANMPKSLATLGLQVPMLADPTQSFDVIGQGGGGGGGDTNGTASLAAQLDQLQQLLQPSNLNANIPNLNLFGLPNATNLFKAPGLSSAAKGVLLGTTTDNPLPSVVIAKGTGNRNASSLQPDLFAPFGNGLKQLVAQQDQQLSPDGERASAHTPTTGGGSPPGSGSSPQRTEKPATTRESSRSSKFRGVTKHRRSGRYEAHIWSKEIGRQVYLGGYECEEHAAEAYDIAALKCKGRRTKTNFELSKYEDLLNCIDRMTMEELVMAVRRQSQGFSRGTSSYRGVTLHPSGRYEARIGVPGSKHIYLGLYSDERAAAAAYDRALVRLRGRNAATNFSIGDYKAEMADYHVMQGKLLTEDPRFASIQEQPQLFDKWIRVGLAGFPELGGATLVAAEAVILGAGVEQGVADEPTPAQV